MNAGIVTRELEHGSPLVEAAPATPRCSIAPQPADGLNRPKEAHPIDQQNQSIGDLPQRRRPVFEAVLKLPSDSAHAQLACREIVTKFELFNYNEREIIAARTALYEALSNAMEHGNGNDPSRQLQVSYAIDESRCVMRVCDEGDGFDPATLPDPTLEENVGSECAGRGWLIMRHFMSEVAIVDPGNCVVLTLERGRRW